VAKLYTIHPSTNSTPKDIIAIVSTSPHHGHTKALCQDMEYIIASTTFVVSQPAVWSTTGMAEWCKGYRLVQICTSVCCYLWLLEITESIDFEGLGYAVSLCKSN
jgi:hypothetical protein